MVEISRFTRDVCFLKATSIVDSQSEKEKINKENEYIEQNWKGKTSKKGNTFKKNPKTVYLNHGWNFIKQTNTSTRTLFFCFLALAE